MARSPKTPPSKDPKEAPASPKKAASVKKSDADRLDVLSTDFERLKLQKARVGSGVEQRTLLNLAYVNNEQYAELEKNTMFVRGQEPNKLNLTFDMIGPRMDKLLGRLSSVAPPFKAQPSRRDPKAYAMGEVVDRMISAIDHKVGQPTLNWKLLWWLMVGGVACEYTPWVPNAVVEPMPQFTDGGELLFKSMDGQTYPQSMVEMSIQQGSPKEMFEVFEEAEPVGDVGAEIHGPLSIFVDQNVESIKLLSPDQRVYVASIRTVGWIEEIFGKVVEGSSDISMISTSLIQPNSASSLSGLRDMLPMFQGCCAPEDPGMALVVEAYSPASTRMPHGSYECFVPGKALLHSDDNPYDEVPLTDFHWKPVTTSFWTGGYVDRLRSPQKFINKRISQLGEQSNASLYSTLLLGGSIGAQDIPADKPGVIEKALSDAGVPLVQRLGPPELPQWFLMSLDKVVAIFNDLAGGADLFTESKFPGQLRGPMAVPMLQEILDGEWGPLFTHLAERLGQVKQYRLNRVKQFYPPIRTMHYTDRDQKNEVLVFNSDQVLRGNINFNIQVERGELIPELRALREARVMERLNSPLAIMYMDPRTGQLDKGKIADDLKTGDEGRESRESQYRKLGREIVDMLWQLKPLPPVLPFYDHHTMMDELEASMATTEFLQASPQLQQAFSMRWEAHRQFLIMEAQQQQQLQQSQQVQGAVAQATQQAAATAAAEAVDAARSQIRAQGAQPTGSYVQEAEQGAQAQRPAGPQAPVNKRTLTVKEER